MPVIRYRHGPAPSPPSWSAHPYPPGAMSTAPPTVHPMALEYGTARSPQPTVNHTCKIRRRLHKGWANPTSQDDCPACGIDRQEGWAELLASIRREVFVHDPHG